MTTSATERPASDEYAPYFEQYVSLVPEGDVVARLGQQLDTTLRLLRAIDEDQANHRYAPDKWSIKEVIGHLIDAERIFAYRALRISRGDATPLAGFEQNDYVPNANSDARELADLAAEFACVRQSTLHLLKSLSDEAWLRRGVANDNEVSVRALAYMMAGHEAHHVQVIKSRYL
jgi:uncharacterized damage-inducible protein DinB